MNLKKLLCGALCAAMVFSCADKLTFLGSDEDFSITASAAGFTVNATDVSLYAVPTDMTDDLSLPAGYPTSFQLKVTGATDVKYSSSGLKNITVSDTGLITIVPALKYYYVYEADPRYMWVSDYPMEGKELIKTEEILSFGTATVRVTSGSQTVTVKVTLVNYAFEYAEQVVSKYVSEVLMPLETDYEKLDKIGEFIAARPYNGKFQSWQELTVSGGDCWASTDTAVELCTRVGIEAWSRNGNLDTGAGGGHMNAMAKTSDGKYYEIEAGYGYTNTPRPYRITERTSLFSYKLSGGVYMIYQYDGKDSVLEIPSAINGKTIEKINDSCFRRNTGNFTLREAILPDTIKTIGASAFYGSTSLKKVNIPGSVTSIGKGAFENTGLTRIYIPDSVTELGEGSVGLKWDSSSKSYVPVEDFVLYCSEGSAAEEYAKANGITYARPKIMGDVDGNGEVNRVDKMLLARYIAHWDGYDKLVDTELADLNGDGKINRIDQLLLARSVAGWKGYSKYTSIMI